MASSAIKRIAFQVLLTVGAVLWIAALLLLAQSAQNSERFGELHSLILFINAVGVMVLLVVIGVALSRLIRDYRRHLPGSRLRARMLLSFVILVVLPLLVVYYFAVQFLNSGIDSWFTVEVEEGLQDALSLTQTVLDIRKREYLARTEEAAAGLVGWPDLGMVNVVGRLRRTVGATSLTVVDRSGRIIATSQDRLRDIQALLPGEELLQQIGQGRPYVRMEPTGGGGYRVITAVDIPLQSPLMKQRALLGQFPVVARLGHLADTVDQTYTKYRGLMYLREPLKQSFTLTLTLVLLLSFLGAVYGAIFFADRLVLPIQQLVAGTRAVAKGDFDTQLPPGSSRDEIGFLINSFNDMTRRLGKARETAARSQQLVESQRANLAIILARLSTGVISLDEQLRIRTANEAAGAILGTQLGSRVGETLEDVSIGQPLLVQFLGFARGHLDQNDFEWREQFVLHGELGSRVLMCACTPLPGGSDQPGGFVLVFDDITALLQAQRDAAWGEVARRLAHEIKNPLTPIQLSAERLRRRYLGTMNAEDSQFLERATHTIVQQVEAMKDMVNAFSEYARAPDLDVSKVDVNKLIGEVLELYRAREMGVEIKQNLDPELGEIEVDAGRLRQILHNLIRNAFEALGGDRNGKVEVFSRLHDQDDCPVAEILVRDNGPGFQMDLVSRVFDPYVTSKPKGTGLGLAIVKKLVEEHGGKIEAGNYKEGGAEVRVLLPVNETARQAMMEQRRGEVRRESA